MKGAEQFDELDLCGGWELVSYTGNYAVFTTPYLNGDIEEEKPCTRISDCKYLYLEDCIYADEYNYTTDSDIAHIFPLSDFTPNNKYNEWFCVSGSFTKQGLPPTSDENDIHVITDYFISNNNKLHIQLYTTTLHFIIESLTATDMRLKSPDGKFYANYKRISNPSNITELRAPDCIAEETYNLNGIKTNPTTKGVKIIRRGKEVSKRIR